MNRTTLFDLPDPANRYIEPPKSTARHRRADPQTSADAARSVDGHAVEDVVLAIHRDHPEGLTDQELVEIACAAADRDPGTVKTARSRVAKRGWLRDSGHTRPSPRGQPMIVWQLHRPAEPVPITRGVL